MRISDWSSDVCSSDLVEAPRGLPGMPFNFPEGSPFEEFFKRFGSPQGQPESRHATALGSGFIIDADGYVVTNNHVIDGASEVTVRLGDETRSEARRVGKECVRTCRYRWSRYH